MKINKDVVSLVARLIIGGVFITAGWMKVSNMAGTIEFFGSVGLAPFFAYLVGYVEFIGGILLVLGICVEKVAMVLSIVMIVAIYITKPMGFQAYSSPLETLGALVAIMGIGAGKYSVRLGKSQN